MNIKLAAALCAIATLTTRLQAQERDRVVGVGLTVPDLGLLLPINVSPHFRIEPYVVFYAIRGDFPTSSDTTWDSRTRLGVGLFSVTRPGESVRVYFGPRFGLLWGSTSVNGSSTSGAKTSVDNSGWFLGLSIGGEYRPASPISLGGEAKIEYQHTSASASGPGTFALSPDLASRSLYSTGALVVRFYP